MGGRPEFKRRMQTVSPIEDIALPINGVFEAYVRQQADSGREVILVTAADQSTATHIASRFPYVSEGVGSSGSVNLSGRSKGVYLANRYGERGFVYAGNERRDLQVWERAGGAIVVNPSMGLVRSAAKLTTVEQVFEDRPPRFRTVLRQLRPHQWLKNILIFVPVFTAHRLGDQGALVHALVAFAAFCAAASGAYVLNDIVDLPSDRVHATKKRRPFASGDLPIEWGIGLLPVLFGISIAMAATLPAGARWMLLGYVVATLLYSFVFKRMFLLDAIMLACLYAARLVMGHLATGIPLSRWLIAFALCMFLSLALLKRFCELRDRDSGTVPGRGYHVDHLKAIGVAGIAAGVLSTGVMALYAGGEHAKTLYMTPAYIYLLCPVFLAWILRMWKLGYAGKMHEDPVLFTLHDLFSVATLAVTVGVVFLAR